MKQELLSKTLGILTEADKAYVRAIREYATVKENPGTRNLVAKYINDIRDTVFDDVSSYLNAERRTLIDGVTTKPVARDAAGEIKRNNELILMRSAIDGADNSQLAELASRYANTEYMDDFKIMIQPRLKALSDNQSPERIKNAEIVDSIMNILDKVPDEISEDIGYIDSLEDDVRSMLYFNTLNFPLNIQPNDNGRIMHGGSNLRHIDNDIRNADVNFNPLGGTLDPLTTTESLGGRQYKTIRYQFNWDMGSKAISFV